MSPWHALHLFSKPLKSSITSNNSSSWSTHPQYHVVLSGGLYFRFHVYFRLVIWCPARACAWHCVLISLTNLIRPRWQWAGVDWLDLLEECSNLVLPNIHNVLPFDTTKEHPLFQHPVTTIVTGKWIQCIATVLYLRG